MRDVNMSLNNIGRWELAVNTEVPFYIGGSED